MLLPLSQTSGKLLSQSSRRVHRCVVCDLGDRTDANSLFADELLRLQADHHHRPSGTGCTAFHLWNMDKQMVWEIFQRVRCMQAEVVETSWIVEDIFSIATVQCYLEQLSAHRVAYSMCMKQ